MHRFIPAYHGSCPKDARVFSVHSEIIENRKVFTLFITGSIRRNDISKDIELSDRRNYFNTIDPSSADTNFNGNWLHPDGWKHGLLRLKYTFNEDGTVDHIESINDIIGSGARTWVPDHFTEETLADCTSWHGRAEKNYAMYYDEDQHRMVLNFHMNWGPSPGHDGYTMVFYTKPYNGIDDDFETYEDKGWTLHRPPHSDIFSKLEGRYGTWSCTSPFLLYHGQLHAAGHMKVVYQKYLDKKIYEWFNKNPAITSFDAFEQYFSGDVDGVPRDHLLHSIIDIVNRIARLGLGAASAPPGSGLGLGAASAPGLGLGLGAASAPGLGVGAPGLGFGAPPQVAASDRDSPNAFPAIPWGVARGDILPGYASVLLENPQKVTYPELANDRKFVEVTTKKQAYAASLSGYRLYVPDRRSPTRRRQLMTYGNLSDAFVNRELVGIRWTDSSDVTNGGRRKTKINKKKRRTRKR
jgi:hypothetical protein